MQEPQEYAQTQVSEERRQRVSQAKKRYNCYTEKNNSDSIEVDTIYGNVTQTFQNSEKEAARCPGKSS